MLFISKKNMSSKTSKKLHPHEKELLESKKLVNVTHANSTAIWLDAPSSKPNEGFTNVYRPMGDEEVLYLVKNNQLPTTQPYQAIIEGENGRQYAEKYLNGKKKVDTHPTTVVEFTAPEKLIQSFYEVQMKCEDGAISIGLGNKAGNCIGRFNQSIANGDTTWRIVKVKRKLK